MAWIIDAIILGVVGSIIAGTLGLGFIGFYGTDPRGFDFSRPFLAGGLLGGAWIAWVLVEAAISGAYFVYAWTRWGASLGQRFLNLQVRSDADGGLLTQDQAIKRWALLVVPIIGSIPGLGFLVFLYQIFLAWSTAEDPNKQGFHDHQCATVVVQAV